MCTHKQGVIFESTEELKAHYRTDWHRYNLKRDTSGLPVVGKELFDRVVMQAEASKSASQKVVSKRALEEERGSAEIGRSSETIARVVRSSQRRNRRGGEKNRGRGRFVGIFRRGDGDDNGSDWESVDEDEAEAVLARIESMNIEEGEEDEDEFPDNDGNSATVTLADNGFELIIHRPDGQTKRIGPRELKRYYKQRHKPSDEREEDEIAREELYERMTKHIPEKKLGTVKGERGNGNGLAQRWVKINQLQRRSEKSQQKYMAKSHNIFAGSGNKKFDMNMQNAKTKLPKSVPY